MTTAQEDGTLARSRDALWQAVWARDEDAAARAVFAALDAGVDPEAVLLDVIAHTQREVGRAWAENRFSVAQEHSATAIHERIIAAMAHRVPAPVTETPGTTVTVACVDGEWHALPARLLAEVLRLRGLRVDFLGAQVPTPHLIAHLHATVPTAVALSSSLPLRLPTAHSAITAVQAIGVPVVAGGAAFGTDGRYARLLGADAWAPDARSAAGLLERGLPRPAGGAVRQSVDDLPHLVDQEYTLVVRAKRRLVRNTLAGLEERLPAMRAYSEAQRERTAEDVLHIVEFLACSLYTDDSGLFTGFLDWTADILEARQVPARVLEPALALLQKELKDFPRTLGLLDQGRDTLRRRGTRPSVPGPGAPA
ncbi:MULTISPECIES: B12-binding domain-containing protein [unclassified Streptomyces]|uniref:cobalamin B12-binding domain-containing protein n=1 Tax=unclassified Streptomyces TaxID=2593676 RepID=UPI00074B2E10|nr:MULTISPECIES: cobalamin-dependent protein [unclassified Streptomyces]KUL69135.1 cobalamin-binding protein [Streptomyces sp. NRRL WC-3605]KUL80342.1 cobalamin-binding protein [Streptomyces sp. NRRL WC-3604]